MSKLPLEMPSSMLPASIAGVRRVGSEWTAEILQRMDWKRFQEVTSMLLARAGFQTEVAWIRPDGTVTLYVDSRNKNVLTRSLLQCAAWTGYRINAQTVMEFFKAMTAEQVNRGILVTPGEIDQAARIFARNKNLELIDGAEFLGTVGRMSAEERSYYLRLATVGPWDVPSCPACGAKMERGILSTAGVQGMPPRDFVFKERTRQHVGVEIACRKIHIKSGADVLFLKPLEVETMLVEGRAMGNIVCTGKLTISPGGCVSGLVAARSIKLEPGGLLEAEARILNAREIHPVTAQPKPECWLCPQAPRCRAVLPLREISA